MNRRNLLTGFGSFLFGFAVSSLSENVMAEDKDDSPHGEAIALILSKNKHELKQAEQRYLAEHGPARWRNASEVWWFDTVPRHWSVVRPYAPGVIDSTHLFTVHYSIDNKTFLSWSVDTKKKTVVIREFAAGDPGTPVK